MVKEEKQVKKICSSNFRSKDLHIILTYQKEVEPEAVEKDILRYLGKIRTIAADKFEYCYTVRPILDKHPAVHILLRPNKRLNEEELKNIWDKGMAKASVVTPADKRAMDYYLTKWGGKVHHSRGLA